MSATVWGVIIGCTIVTFAIKGFGPALTGGRQLSPEVVRVVTLLAPALLTALVVTSALADGKHLHLGADTAGVAVAGLVTWRGASVIIAVTVAAAVTALLRVVA